MHEWIADTEMHIQVRGGAGATDQSVLASAEETWYHLLRPQYRYRVHIYLSSPSKHAYLPISVYRGITDQCCAQVLTLSNEANHC
jgi:hypothetical protein